MLRKDQTLGVAAMVVVLLASLIGSLPDHSDIQLRGVFFGLDFFILNVLFMGVLFVPLERLFARHKDQTVFRDEWREDLFYYLVSSLLVQVLTYLTLAPSNYLNAQTDFGAVRGWVHGLPWIIQLAVIMVLTDLAQYWVHRAFHRIPFHGTSTLSIIRRSPWTGSPVPACTSSRSSCCAALRPRRCSSSASMNRRSRPMC